MVDRDAVPGEHWPFTIQLSNLAMDDMLDSSFCVELIKMMGTHNTGSVDYFIISFNFPLTFLRTNTIDGSLQQAYFICMLFFRTYADTHGARPTFLCQHGSMYSIQSNASVVIVLLLSFDVVSSKNDTLGMSFGACK